MQKLRHPLNNFNHLNLFRAKMRNSSVCIYSYAPATFKSSMLDYFENYYIGQLKQPTRRNSKQRLSPLFHIDQWNCYERILKDIPRKNNSLGSWHKQFSLFVKVT